MNKNVDINISNEHHKYERSITTDDSEAVDETLQVVLLMLGRDGSALASPSKPGRRTGGRVPRAGRTSTTETAEPEK